MSGCLGPEGLARYQEFIASKRILAEPAGKQIEADSIHPVLSGRFEFQRDIVRWAVGRGRAALFEDCGLGKTVQQLEWARLIGEPTLILTPLAVGIQTVAEAEEMLGLEARLVAEQSECWTGINVTNYEKLHHFDPSAFGAIVLDESSILKAFDGKTRKALTEFARDIPYRLACTATPAPNDLLEITNHAEFLDIMSGKEIVALFFTQDGNTTHKWRLKRHAEKAFWEWLASWCVALRMPSDLGYEDHDFVLPPLNHHQVEIACAYNPRETLFDMGNLTLQERRRARRASLAGRVEAAARLANESEEPWLLWCDLNAESEALTKAIPDAVEVRGTHSQKHKEEALIGFARGEIRVLVTKPSIAGFGMNWQHCANVAFVGLSDSYEQIYQATRRCWRFGQKKPVNVYHIVSTAEGAVVRNVKRKEREADRMFQKIVEHMRGWEIHMAKRDVAEYETEEWSGEGWDLWLGDSCERIREVEDESVGLSVFSPPFPSMYAYTNSERDLGNCKSPDDLVEHFSFLMGELLRVTMPGRLCCVHLLQTTTQQNREGYIGLVDFRGKTIQAMVDAGWRFAGEVTIEKNPQVQAVRNKERGLLFKSLATDSSMMRMALADYIVYFRKDGDNPLPVRAGISERYGNPNGWITEREWIEWAAPVWFRRRPGVPGGIQETDVLNVRAAKGGDDERHLCPLQLGVIERCVKLWSAPGDLVLSPFAGIGSEGYMAVKLGRRFLGIELKRSYAEVAVKHLRRVENQATQPKLFPKEATA